MTENADNPIRILIVDDMVEASESLRKLLQFEPDFEVIGTARSAQEAFQQAADKKPDVVLMDTQLPDVDGITATQKLLEEAPFIQVIMMSVAIDSEQLRRAMMAGARDLLPKPPSGEELVSAIRLISERARERRHKVAPIDLQATEDPRESSENAFRPQGKLIAIYSAKGGVGCSTLATNLAIGLHTDETNTVLVDANLQFGDVAILLNLPLKFSVVDLTSNSEELDPEIVEGVLLGHDCGLRVLAAPPRPEMADEVKAEQAQRVLRYLRTKYAYVVVDTGSTMNDIALAVLDEADLLVMIATPEIPAIKDARLTFDLLNLLGFPKERVLFVLNKVDPKNGIGTKEIAANLKHEVDAEIPANGRAVSASINQGVPLMLNGKGRSPAKEILNLLGTIKDRLITDEVALEDLAG